MVTTLFWLIFFCHNWHFLAFSVTTCQSNNTTVTNKLGVVHCNGWPAMFSMWHWRWTWNFVKGTKWTRMQLSFLFFIHKLYTYIFLYFVKKKNSKNSRLWVHFFPLLKFHLRRQCCIKNITGQGRKWRVGNCQPSFWQNRRCHRAAVVRSITTCPPSFR